MIVPFELIRNVHAFTIDRIDKYRFFVTKNDSHETCKVWKCKQMLYKTITTTATTKSDENSNYRLRY